MKNDLNLNLNIFQIFL